MTGSSNSPCSSGPSRLAISRRRRARSACRSPPPRANRGARGRLGVKLIVRTTRQISLTAVGEALLERARDALAAVDDAENAARGADRLSGILRIALPPGYGAWRIVPLLPAFLDRHPLLKVDLMMSDRFENLIAEGADLAIRIGEQADSSFVARKLESTSRLFVASPGYLEMRGWPERLADLAGHDFIGGPVDASTQKLIGRRNGRAEVLVVAPRIVARSAAGIAACAAAGLGVAVGSAWMCAEDFGRALSSPCWRTTRSIR